MDTKPKVDLQALAKEVAKFLPGWTWRGPLYEHTTDTHVVITNADGAQITVSGNGWTRDGRLTIGAGRWPKTKKGEECGPNGYSDPHPRITVAENRPAKDIAREIERRFLPDYLPLYAKMVEQRNAIDVRQDSAKVKVTELTKIIGGETRGLEAGDGEVHWFHEDATYGDAKSHDGGKEWNLQVHNLPYDKVARILKIVKE